MTRNLLEMVESGEIAASGAKAKLPITISNVNTVQQVYRIPVKYLYYNNENGRISTHLSRAEKQYVPQSDEEDTIYNDIFAKYIIEGNEAALKKTKKSIKANGQQQYGFVLKDGRIVDGNRRFTALRQIQSETGQSQFFEAVILPFSYDARAERAQIKKLELKLQMGIEDKLSYDPLDLSVDIYHTVVEDQLMTADDYANESAMTKKDIANRIAAVELIHEFLDFINADQNAYHIIKDANLYNPLYESAKRFKKYYPIATPQYERTKEALFATFGYMILSGGDTVRETREYFDTVVKNAATNTEYSDKIEDTIDDLRDALEAAPVNSTADLTKRLTDNVADLRKLKSEYKKISDRENRGRSVESFVASVESLSDALKDMVRYSGATSQLSLSNLNDKQIEVVRDFLVQIHTDSETLIEVYTNAL